MMRGLYIHIPFCSGKCNYCAFVSSPEPLPVHRNYLKALNCEMRFHHGVEADTLYIGGGTPSQLETETLKELLVAVESNFRPIAEFAEATFEANPETLTRDKIMLLKQFGVNRVSLGLQSASDRILESLGRRHRFEDFIDVYLDLRSVGFSNINVDLMAGVPGQSAEDFAFDLAKIAELKPEHVSVYALQIEEGTAFHRRGIKPDDDLARDMLDLARAELLKSGYGHYEISNFSRPGRESLHNLNYWDNGEYLGLGCAAASYMNGVRRSNTDSLDNYCALMPSGPELVLASYEELAGKDKAGEDLMLGLRKLKGMPLTSEMRDFFGAELSRLEDRGLITVSAGNARLTQEGIYLSNEVFRAFVPPY